MTTPTESLVTASGLAQGAREPAPLRRLQPVLLHLEQGLRRMDKRVLFLLLLCLELVVLLADIETDPQLSIGPYFLLPILLSAWFLEQSATFFFVTLSTILRIYGFRQIFPEDATFFYWHNIALTGAVYAVFATLVIIVRRSMLRLARHARLVEAHRKRLARARRLEASIHRAKPEHADDIVRLTVGGGFESQAVTPERLAQFAAAWRSAIAKGTTVRNLWTGGSATVPGEFWVSVINGEVAGYMFVVGFDDKRPADCELHAIVIAEAYRGLGIGSAMTDFFCKHFKYHRRIIACRPGSTMMTMVEARGFNRFATSSNGYILLEKPAHHAA